MTIDFQSAEGALSRELVRLESLTALRDALREIGSMQQAADEAGKRLAAAQADEAGAQDQLDAIEQKVVAAQNAAAIEIAQAQSAVADAKAKAKAAAAEIVDEAKAQAAQIISDAKTATAESTRRAQVLIDALKAVS